MPRLEVRLPSDRHQPGEIVLRNDEGNVVGGPFPIIGRASPNFGDEPDPNPSRDPLRRYGHTPMGEYWIYDVQRSGPGTIWPESSYGRVGVIRLIPLSGDAARAQENGRTGIHIHARANDNGVLIGTGGCLRMREKDLERLIVQMRILELFSSPTVTPACSVENDPRFVLMVEQDDTVGPHPYYELDPPPGVPSRDPSRHRREPARTDPITGRPPQPRTDGGDTPPVSSTHRPLVDPRVIRGVPDAPEPSRDPPPVVEPYARPTPGRPANTGATTAGNRLP